MLFLYFSSLLIPRPWRSAATNSLTAANAQKRAAVAAAAICLVVKAYMRGGNS